MATIAFDPEVPLFKGEIVVTEEKKSDDPSDRIVCYVQLPKRKLNFSLDMLRQRPLRTRFTLSPLNSIGKPVECNVDLELDPQPPLETVVRAAISNFLSQQA